MGDTYSELISLIGRLEQAQADLGLTDTQFASRFSKHVGSPKTWTDRFRARNFAELGDRVDKWTAKLRALVTQLDGGVGTATVYSSLPIVKHAAFLYERLQGQDNDRRNAMLVGINGVGKTLALRHIHREHPRDTLFLSANECWKDSRMEIAGGLARALGKAATASAAGTFRLVLEELKFSPKTILIDEAHEGGVLLLKLVKSLINETRCRTILSLYPSAWSRLLNGNSDAYAEAQQLLRRTYRPVWRNWVAGVSESDVQAYLAEATPFGARCKELAAKLTPLVRQNGGLSLVSDAIDAAEIIAEHTSTKLTEKHLEDAVREQLGLGAHQ